MYRAALITPNIPESLYFVAEGGELVDYFRRDEAFAFDTEDEALAAAANAVKSLGGTPERLRNFSAIPQRLW
jgi:hypothetical protein